MEHICNSIKKKDYKAILYSLLFFNVFLSGADLLSFNMNGSNVRFFYIYVIITSFIFLCKFRYKKKYVFSSLIFLFSLMPSIYQSLSPLKSFFSMIMLFINIFFLVGIINVLVSILDLNRDSLIKIIIYAYRIQILFSILFVLLGITERAQFFYYEPSYMGLSLVLYTSTIFYNAINRKSIKLDLLFLLAFLYFSYSANFLLSILVVSSLYMMILKPRYILIFLLSLCIITIAYISLVNDLNTIAIRNLLDGNINFSQFLLRGGNRMSRVLSAIDVFYLHPIFGVGFNAYEEYSMVIGINDYSGGIGYLSAKGGPPINIYIELLATSGIIGLSGFLILIAYIFLTSFKNMSPFFIAVIAMLIMLNFESSIMRPYFWVAIALALSDYSLKTKKNTHM